MTDFHTRIFLITPPKAHPTDFAPELELALSGGDIACLLIDQTGHDKENAEILIKSCLEIAQPAGTAVLIRNDLNTALQAITDGVHINVDHKTYNQALEYREKEQIIIGADNLTNRDAAMQAGEKGVDYLFFGNLDQIEDNTTNNKMLELGTWWVELFETPCVIMAGQTLASIKAVAEAGIDFVALRSAVWEYEGGPQKAIDLANQLLKGQNAPPSHRENII